MPLLHFFAWEPCPRSFRAHLPFLLFIQDGRLVDIFFLQVREGVLEVKVWRSHVSPILHSPTYFPFNFCNLLHFDLPNCIIQLRFSDLITRSTGSSIPHSQTDFCYIRDFSTFLLHIAHFIRESLAVSSTATHLVVLLTHLYSPFLIPHWNCRAFHGIGNRFVSIILTIII